MEKETKSAFGMIGLGTMGSNLLQNIADHGYICTGYDNDSVKVNRLNSLGHSNIQGFLDIGSFINNLKSPRIIMLLVPAGKIVDSVIDELLKRIDRGDIIIDGGNSHFTDTDRRSKYLESKGFHFIGMGVSGGEEGARKGPSMMPGGDKKAYDIVKPILQKIAAQINGTPTVAYMGTGSAGHFVKMVHNGIEYTIMQLLSETYEILKKGLKLKDSEIHDVFDAWNRGRLQSYLVEITRDIFNYKNKGSEQLLLNDIKDEAKAKGTGKWTSQAAMDLSLPVPIIDIAVSMRDLSKYKDLRISASKQYLDNDIPNCDHNQMDYIPLLEQAFYFAMVSAYAQGMHLLYTANTAYDYNLNLDKIAQIWRGGCIIRSEFLEDIYTAYTKNPHLNHLFLDDTIHQNIIKSMTSIRTVVSDATQNGIAIPAYGIALAYFDNFRNKNMPTNLVQAQRDYFGSHTYELKDKAGTFHTEWKINKD